MSDFKTIKLHQEYKKLQSELDKERAYNEELTNANIIAGHKIQALEAQVAELKNTLQHTLGKIPCPSKIDTKGEAIQILQDVINKTLKQYGSLHKPIYFIWLKEALSKVEDILGKGE